ncbi:MAG TPA: efflux RND transporter periplasmic adaptor subunit [Polyangiaceae bacterium]
MSDQHHDPLPDPNPLLRLPEDEDEGPPRGVRMMAALRWLLVALMAVVAVVSAAYSFGLIAGGTASAAGTTYYCPMHPQVVQDRPGECPICSMSLVPKERAGAPAMPKTEHSASHDGHRHNPSDPYSCPMHPEETGLDENARCPICKMKLEKRALSAPTGQVEPPAADAQGVPGLVTVDLSMDRVQLIGVRTAKAVREPLASELRTVGYIAADEGKLARVHTRFSGWIEALAVSNTGQKVRRGQLLASIYNLELLPAQQEFLAARRWSSSSSGSPSQAGEVLSPSLEQDARTRLELLGMSHAEIERIAQTGRPSRTIGVTAPVSGYVVSKPAVQGAFVQPGTELFEIADLSTIWVLVEVYEYELGRVELGQTAHVEVASQAGKRLEGKIGFIYPTVDPSTRTLRLRVELDNKELKLRPGMYADVAIELGEQAGVVIPREALVDTGEHQYVFVAKEGGRFEPRLVGVGARSGERVQIVSGLRESETVVTTANFMIDSESRLRATIEATPAKSGAPAPAASFCDANFDETKYPDKHADCLECERVHRGMGSMDEDCKNAIPKPWR